MGFVEISNDYLSEYYERRRRGTTPMTSIWMQPPSAHTDEVIFKRQYGYCNICHAFVPITEKRNHEDFHNNYTYRKDGNMSSVVWCDYGNHAFKANAPGSAHFNGTEVGENGLTETVSMDACA